MPGDLDPARWAGSATPWPVPHSRPPLRDLLHPAALTVVLLTKRLPAEHAALPVRGTAPRRAGTSVASPTAATVPPAAVGLFEWSPDSRRIAFVADGSGGREPRAVSVVSRDGGTLVSFADPNRNPVWDPCWLGEGRVAER